MPGSLKAQQLGCKKKKAGVSLNQRSGLWGCHISHMPLVNAIIGPIHIQDNEDWAFVTGNWSPGLHVCQARAPRLNCYLSLLLVTLRQGVAKMPRLALNSL